MAQYRLNAYDADVFIPEFKGLMQYGDQMGSDLRYAESANNVETEGGVLQAARDIFCSRLPASEATSSARNAYIACIPDAYTTTRPTIPSPVPLPERALIPNAIVTDRLPNYTGWGSVNPNVFLIFYQYHILKLEWLTLIERYRKDKITSEYITELTVPEAVTMCYPNAVTNYEYIPENETDPKVCMMIAFNAGLYRYASDSFVKVDNAPSNGKFIFIERYAERLWGMSGDTLYYSRPYDMEDWSQDNDDPANGGGEIRIPTWDGDKLTAMKAFGDCLVIFSQKRAWKITGSDPSNFMIQEQYGNGCNYPETIAVDGNRLLMIQNDCIAVYDGVQIQRITENLLTKYFHVVDPSYNNSAHDNSFSVYASATIVDGHYLLSTTGISIPDAARQIIDYNINDGTILVRDFPPVVHFCPGIGVGVFYDPIISQEVSSSGLAFVTEANLWEKALYATVETTDGEKRATYLVSNKEAVWQSPWITLGRTDIKKGGFELYFTPEVLTDPVTINISIQTEKKTKTKSYTIEPLSDADFAAGKKHKMKRLHFGGAGRRFRVIIKVPSGNIYPWRLIGGIQIVAETDVD